ncbi:hypothetical protein UCDDS831_g05842 [Diplodia seriata]|uniref:EF-hand domain-containing protein n=1 Tax=Diplodia seriata TaxID=420778 RepID=A0A0G2E6A6_9PEZI|nr:hypothetical protein UCDDS831_g05842 [Diplodia seriata]
MASDKDKDKTLTTGEIAAMLKRSEQQEHAAHKRATKAAKRFAKQDLTAEEEDVATRIRKQLANVSGYLYKPDYQYADLRTEPPCDRPEYSAYTKKQMREGKGDEEKREEETEEAEAATSVKDFALRNELDVHSGVPTKKEIDEAAEAIMPNIQRLSMLADSSEDSDSDDDSVVSSTPSKGSDGGSTTTATFNAGLNKPSSSKEPPAAKSTASPSPIVSTSEESPSTIYNEDFSSHSTNTGVQASGADPETKTADDEVGKLDSAERVHPWPNLWPKYSHKPPNMDPKQWAIVNANLGTLGASKDGAIDPCDDENLEAYQQVQDILETSWLVMTGQLPPDGNHIAQKILKPMLQKEKPDMGARLRVYEEKLTLRRRVLKLPGEEWKRLSGESDKSFNSPYTVAVDSFANSAVSPSTSKRSSTVSNQRSSANLDKRGSQSDIKTPVAEADSKSSSAHSSFRGVPGAQTPSKRGRMASFTNALKIPKSPKKGTKSQENSGTANEEVITTPRDAPPVPIIPTTFSAQNTPQTSFDTATSTTGTPVPYTSPAIPSLNRKVSRSFGGTPSISMAGRHTYQRQDVISDAGCQYLVQSAGRNTPNASAVDLSMPKGARKHSRTSSGISMPSNIFDAHLDELLNEFRAWMDGQDDNSRDSEGLDVKKILKPMDYDEIRKLKPLELEAKANEVKKITHADLRAQVLKEHHDARFPPSIPGHPAVSFGGLPYLALRIARHALDVVNEHFTPVLNCDYELENYHFADRQRRWNETHPDDDYPYPGISRPTHASYLKAGYAAAWATRFVQWAQEQEQLWKYENIDLPTMNQPGGGFKRQGRTLEARFLLNMVDEEMDVDTMTGDLKIEGEGAMLKEDQVQEMFEKLAAREEQKGTKKVWAACEEQVKRLATMMDVKEDELLEQSVGTGRSSPEDSLVVITRRKESALARAGLYAGI